MNATKTQLEPGPWIVIAMLKDGGYIADAFQSYDYAIEIRNVHDKSEVVETATIIPARQALASGEMLEACESFTKGWSHFCDRIDFGKSNMDAEAIRFMNEIPSAIAAAFSKASL